MNALGRGNAFPSGRAKILVLAALILIGSSPRSNAGDHQDEANSGHFVKKTRRQGFQGFGLSYHLGYGYGGSAIGVGPDGGYPFYGGPGYPHEAPPLNRCGRIIPFAYQGDPGPPCNGVFRGFQPVGPLAVDTPVVTSSVDPREVPFEGDFGGFTGAIPYPESTFAPYTTNAATTGSLTGVKTPEPPPATPAPSLPPTSALDPQAKTDEVKATALGIEEDPAAEPNGLRGLRVSRTDRDGLAEKAGLHVGDVIQSINGYRTTERGHLTWILANAAPDHLLKMKVRSVADRQERTVTVRAR